MSHLNLSFLPANEFNAKDFAKCEIAIFSKNRIRFTPTGLPQISSLNESAKSELKSCSSFLVYKNRVFAFLKTEPEAGIPIRDAFAQCDEELFHDLLKALHLCQWYAAFKYCTECRADLKISSVEMAKVCRQCGRSVYPTMSPAVIMLVHRLVNGKKEILLARGLPPRKFHSCLAGFVEPGETLEQAVHREILEESGVRVSNLKYFGSQPWPFPGQMMIAYLAEWQSGEIVIDKNEIVEAGWYNKNNLPELPISKSIARQMINYALEI